MKRLGGLMCTALLALPVGAMAADAGDDFGCDDVNWGADAVAALPRIQEACHRVKIMDNKVYAQFVGKVVAMEPGAVTVRFLDRADKVEISEMKLKPASDEMVYRDDQQVKFSDVKKGEKLSFWLEHSKWGLYADPKSEAMTVVSRKAL